MKVLIKPNQLVAKVPIVNSYCENQDLQCATALYCLCLGGANGSIEEDDEILL
jgi:hypothetical protein